MKKIIAKITDEIIQDANKLNLTYPQFNLEKYALSFTAYEKRILVSAIEILKSYSKGEVLKRGFDIKEIDSSGDLKFTLPISSLMGSKKNENYSTLKRAFYTLLDKKITDESNAEWKATTLIEKPKIRKWRRTVSFIISAEVSNVLLNIGQNIFRSLSLKGSYAIRFFNLLPRTSKPVSYSLDNLKSKLDIGGKYKETYKFIHKVILPAKKELDKSSPFTFTYTTIKTGKKITGFTFTPIKNKQAKAINPPNPIKAAKVKASPIKKASSATKPKKPKTKSQFDTESSQLINPIENDPVTLIEPESKNKGSWVKRVFKRLLGKKR